MTRPQRQHRFRGDPGSRVIAGKVLQQWQIDVTGSGRIWYCIDDALRRAIIVLASTKHPKATE